MNHRHIVNKVQEGYLLIHFKHQCIYAHFISQVTIITTAPSSRPLSYLKGFKEHVWGKLLRKRYSGLLVNFNATSVVPCSHESVEWPLKFLIQPYSTEMYRRTIQCSLIFYVVVIKGKRCAYSFCHMRAL